MLREWIHRLRGTLRLGRRDGDLEEELRLHLELAAEDARRRGSPAHEAMRGARMRAGSASQAMEALRDQRTLPWVAGLPRDLRYGLRTLRRSPAFTVAALLTLALGIGATTAVYQLLDAIRLRALPVADPHELAIVELADLTPWRGRRTTGHPALTNPLWEQIRDHQEVFAGVLAWSGADLRLDRVNALRVARGLFVSGEFFNVLGVQPLMGRVFTAADDRPGCGLPGAVVSYRFWRARLGGDAAAIGRTIALESRTVEVIGVTAPAFSGLEVGRSFDVAVPICSQDAIGSERGWLRDGTTWWLTVMGRLTPGRSLDIVNAQLAAASPGIFEATVPSSYFAEAREEYLGLELRAVAGGGGVSVLRRRYSDPLLFLLVTTGLVLLIACTNLANLILARGSAREREFAVRLAVGASWGRLVRQLMVENALLALAGAAAGLALANVLSRLLIGFLGTGVFLVLPLDARLVAFVLMVAIVTCLTFGLIPAWRASRVAAHEAMKAGARTVSGSREGFGVRQALVVTQVALSVVLIFGALLFGGTLRHLMAVDPGFETHEVATARLDFSRMHIPQAGARTLRRRMLDRIRSVPGVTSAAEVRHVPMGGTASSINVWRDGANPLGQTTVRLNAMSEGYLQTVGIGLTAGRDFTTRDSRSAPNVAIVNQSFARLLGLGGNPVGERFRGEAQAPGRETVFEIIGLVPDTKYFTLREDSLPIAFVPVEQISDPRPVIDIVIHSSAPLDALSSAVRHAAADVSALIHVDLRAFDSTIRDGLMRERLMATLSGFFGVLAALVAVIGVYGVLSYLVVRRTNEIGVRMALGARRGDILTMVLREAGWLLAIGLAGGAALAFGAARLARSFVFGLQPYDIGRVGLACVLLGVAAIVASWLPARRAANFQPLAALREE